MVTTANMHENTYYMYVRAHKLAQKCGHSENTHTYEEVPKAKLFVANLETISVIEAHQRSRSYTEQ